MKKYGYLIKGNIIRECDDRTERIYKGIFKIISIDDKMFFAEEISTGDIFPVCHYIDDYNDHLVLNSFSYIKRGINYVKVDLVTYDEFKFNIDHNFLLEHEPSEVEIENYLDENNKNRVELLKKLEQQNRYYKNITYIKEYISDVCERKYFDISSISSFGYDLALKNNICNLVGREDEIKRIVKSIGIKQKSIILVGESGSGKTSLIESIASRTGDIEWLSNKMIFSLNLNSLIAGTRFRGDFEEKLQKFIDFCREHKDRLIIFIDEIHTLYRLGANNETAIDAMQILKPYLDNNDIQIIGATTYEEFNKYLAKDVAFLRRIERINISSIDYNLNYKILLSYLDELEDKYNIKLELSDKDKKLIVYEIVNLTDISNQKVVDDIKVSNPTISKNIFENAFTEAIFNKQGSVIMEDIYMAILDCEHLSTTYKKEQIKRLRQLTLSNETKEKEIIPFSKVLVKSI